MREVLLVFHILGAAVWIGGGVFTVMGRGAMVDDESTLALRWMAFEEKLGKGFFPGAAIVTLLSGIFLVLQADEYGFGSVFVTIGITAFLISSIGNGVFAGRTDAQAVEALEKGDVATARSTLTRTGWFHAIDTAILVVALVAMVYRWGA